MKTINITQPVLLNIQKLFLGFGLLLTLFAATPSYGQGLPGAVQDMLDNNNEFNNRTVNEWGVYEKNIRFRDITSLKGISTYFGFTGDASNGGAAIFLFDAENVGYEALIWGAYSDNNSWFTHASHWTQSVFGEGQLIEDYSANISTNKYSKRAYMVETQNGSQLYGKLLKNWGLYSLNVKVVVVTFGNTSVSDCQYHVPGIYEDAINGQVLTHTDFHTYTDNCGLLAGNSSSEIHIDRVAFSLQKDILNPNPGDFLPGSTTFSYPGNTISYQEIWGPFGGSSDPVPPYSILNQKPYRIELQDYQSGNGSGYEYHGTRAVGPIYTRNRTTDLYFKINAQIKINNPNGERVYYKAWLDPSHNLGDCSSLESSHSIAGGYTDNEYITIQYGLPDDGTLGMSPTESKTAFLRIAVEKSEAPNLTSVIEEGEVEDFLLEFHSSICPGGFEIPYEYAIYSEGELNYCGPNGYAVSKEAIAYDYRTNPSTGLFEIGEANNIPYGIAKMGKNAYETEYDYLSTAWGSQANIDYYDANGDLNPTFDPLQNQSYRKLMWATTAYEETDPSILADQMLYMDVYYPRPQFGPLMSELKELPLIVLMAGGGFMWQSRNYAKTKRIARWYAKHGYIVSVIDYRQGVYFEKEIMKRAIIRAWQDSRTAVKWWKASGFDRHYDGSNNPIWKVDLDKIYTAGGSAGAITALHNVALTPERLDEQIAAGEFPGVEAGYAIPSSGHFMADLFANTLISEYVTTYDLRDFPSLPCLPTSGGGTTCDWYNTSTDINPTTDKPYWGEAKSALTGDELTEFGDLMTNYLPKSGRAVKAVSLAGAMMSTEYLTDHDNPPMLDVHHADDGIVDPGTNYFFARLTGNWLKDNSVLTLQDLKKFGKLRGGRTLYNTLQQMDGSNNVFKYLEVDGPEKSAAPGHKHQIAFKFGGATYTEYGDAYDDNDPLNSDIHTLEPTLMLYTDAFLTKDYGYSPSQDHRLLWHDFDGDYDDVSGNNINSVPQNGPSFVSTNAGQGSHALSLEGSNDFLNLDNGNAFIHDAFTQRTISFWLYTDNVSGRQDLFDEGGSTNGIAMRINNGSLELAVQNAHLIYTLSGCILPEQWIHVTGVFNEGTLQLYINGELIDENLSVAYTTVATHADAAGFGGTNGTNAFDQKSNNFNGLLDDLIVSDVAMTISEIQSTINDGHQMVSGLGNCDINTDLALWLQLDNNYNDASGNNINSVAQSGLQFTDVAAQGSHAIFNSTEKYIDLDIGNAFIHGAFTERTIAFWMNSGTASSTQDIYDEGGSTNGIALRTRNGQIELAAQNNNQIAMVSSCAEGFRWIHVAGVFNNGTLQLYVNGELVAENSNVGFTTVGSNGDGAGFGATNGSNAFDQVNNGYWGTLDELNVYNRALTSGELRFLMTEATVNPDPDPCGTNAELVGSQQGNNTTTGKKVTSYSEQEGNNLFQVYPNPSTDGRFIVTFELDKPSPVQLTVTAINGRELTTQTLNPESAGQYTLQLDQTQGLPPGMYFLRLDFGSRSDIRKLVIGN